MIAVKNMLLVKSSIFSSTSVILNVFELNILCITQTNTYLICLADFKILSDFCYYNLVL